MTVGGGAGGGLTGGVADLSVSAGDAVEAADRLPLSDPFPGAGLTVLAAHRPGGLQHRQQMYYRHTPPSVGAAQYRRVCPDQINNPLTSRTSLFQMMEPLAMVILSCGAAEPLY